jgi:hypothetical protein
MKQSKFLSLNWLDLGKGLLMVILVAFFNWLQETFVPALNISPEIKVLLITAIAYLSKNLFSGSKKDRLIGTRPPKKDPNA